MSQVRTQPVLVEHHDAVRRPVSPCEGEKQLVLAVTRILSLTNYFGNKFADVGWMYKYVRGKKVRGRGRRVTRAYSAIARTEETE